MPLKTHLRKLVCGEQKKSDKGKEVSTVHEQYVKAISLRHWRGGGENQQTPGTVPEEMHLVLQLIDMLFTQVSSEMISVEGWLSNHS